MSPNRCPNCWAGLQAKALLADKAYDSDKIFQAAQSQGMQAVIARRVNRKNNQRVLDTYRYKARHLVENLFQRMQVFRRVASRYGKLDVTFLGFVHLAGCMKWLHSTFRTAPGKNCKFFIFLDNFCILKGSEHGRQS